MECSHKKISNKVVQKKIFGEIFRVRTEVCKECSAYLHNDVYERKYMKWLENLYRERRDKFQAQCFFSKNLIKCAEEYLKKYPTIPISIFMKFLVIIDLEIIDKDERKSSRLEKLKDQKVLESFLSNEKTKVNIQFKPSFMIELLDIAELLGQTSTAVVENSIVKLMTIITSKDKKLRQFWENEIQEYLDAFLKAA